MGLFGFGRKKREPACCSAVVVAAGSSSRMGMDKILAPLAGEPVIIHTLRAMEQAPSVAEVVLVTREERLVELAQLCRQFGLSKVGKIVRGGSTRTESVYLGAMETDRSAAVIAVQDGARPLVSTALIEKTIAQAKKSGAAAPAIPLKDTVKIARDGVVEQTPDRESLYAVQTPQVFEASLLKAALKQAMEDGAAVTDDCSAVERLGMKVVLVAGEERNIKLTTPVDLMLAECLKNGGVDG